MRSSRQQASKEVKAAYCIGGTLLASTLAYMASSAIRIKAATFMTTLLDFSDMVSWKSLSTSSKWSSWKPMAKRAIGGHHMADVFNLLRENDLVWSFVVNKLPDGHCRSIFAVIGIAFHPHASRHAQFLSAQHVSVQPELREPGGIELNGVPDRPA